MGKVFDSSTPIDVVVPVFNEEAGIEQFYRRLAAVPLKLRPIFVDNASTDRTPEIVARFQGVELIRHARNEGYGASICDGVRASRSEVVVIIDADGEYPPESIPELISALENADVVYGSRFADDRNRDIRWLKSLGNRLISRLFNVFFRQHHTDLYTGMKVLRRSALSVETLRQKGFVHVLEMAVRLAERGVRIVDVPIRFAPRTTGRSQMLHVRETLHFLVFLLWYRVNRRGNQRCTD